MTDHVVLLRHGAPEIEAGVASIAWRLSDAGRAAARRTAERLRAFAVTAIVSSPEPKARETADFVAQASSCPVSELAALREHDRQTAGHLDRETFVRSVANLFEHPDERVFGEETAAQALRRFRDAISEILRAHPSGDVVVVSHGTVIALFVADLTGENGVGLWRSMAMPSWFVLSRSPLAVLEGPCDVIEL
jgi:broad specificity phosphatase PhoE